MTFKRKVQIVLVVLLVVIEGLTFAAVLVETRNNLIDQSKDKLSSATRVFDSAMASRRAELETSVGVLASDFGFKRAIATGDRPTLATVLYNHGKRIDADVAIFLDRQGELVASTDGSLSTNDLPGSVVSALVNNTQLSDRAIAGHIEVLNGMATQLVIAPVRAPEIIGWVAIGFLVDDSLARHIRSLTNVDVAFVQDLPARNVVGTTLSTDDRLSLETAESLFSDQHVDTSSLASGDFLGIAHDFASSAESTITIVLATPFNDVLEAFGTIRIRLVFILLVALLLSWLGASLLASTIARPLRTLAGAARTISKGDYDQLVDVGGSSEVEQLSAAFNDMQQGIKSHQARILYQAQHDALTDLPNRTLVADRLEHAIERSRRHERSFALIMMDLDGFKSINDTLGHNIGDQVLVSVAAQLRSVLRESDTVARFGGDEFLLLLEESDVDDAQQFVRRLSTLFDGPIQIDNMHVRVDISAGIASFPEHGDTSETLVRRADIAMYAAKDLEKQAFAVYEPGRDEAHLRRLQLINELRTALESDALTVHYQPKVDLRTNEVCSVEALVRWIHPELGFLSPDEFIPLAEQSGHIQALTAFVLRKVMQQQQTWKANGLNLAVSINLSAHDLLDNSLPGTIATLLRQHELTAQSLILEVTESAVMKDAAYARGVMKQLQSQGIRLSIDDFGTGHASLAQLKSLPVDELKIDKSFVLDLTSSDDDMVIVRSTINLAHNMGLKVTAEGVESEESRRLLESYDCDVIQGFLISKPLSESDLTKWLLARMEHQKAAVREHNADLIDPEASDSALAFR